MNKSFFRVTEGGVLRAIFFLDAPGAERAAYKFYPPASGKYDWEWIIY
jgi:hypothetical protein